MLPVERILNTRFSTTLTVITIGPAKVHKVNIFTGPYYMIKHVLTFVSDVQESVLVDFISQNKVKILYKVKTCQNCFHQKFLHPNPYNNEKNLHFLSSVPPINFISLYFFLNF